MNKLRLQTDLKMNLADGSSLDANISLRCLPKSLLAFNQQSKPCPCLQSTINNQSIAFHQSLALKSPCLQWMPTSPFDACPKVSLPSINNQSLALAFNQKALPSSLLAFNQQSNVNVIIAAELPNIVRGLNYRTRSAGFVRSLEPLRLLGRARAGLSLRCLRRRCGLSLNLRCLRRRCGLNLSSWSLRNWCCGLGKTSRLQKSNEPIWYETWVSIKC